MDFDAKKFMDMIHNMGPDDLFPGKTVEQRDFQKHVLKQILTPNPRQEGKSMGLGIRPGSGPASQGWMEALQQQKQAENNQNNWAQQIQNQFPSPLSYPSPQELAQQKFRQDYYNAMQNAMGMAAPPAATAPVSPAPVKDLHKDFLVGPILAYRKWKVECGVLKSLNNNQAWPKGEPMVGKCVNHLNGPEVKAPMNGCTCGVYAWKTRERIQGCSDALVCGVVALWGKVLEHKLGYRAEFAYPWALLKPKSPMPGFPVMPTGWEKLAEEYGIKIIEMPDGPLRISA